MANKEPKQPKETKSSDGTNLSRETKSAREIKPSDASRPSKGSNKGIIMAILVLSIILVIVFNLDTGGWYSKEKTAATVNGEKITSEELESRYSLLVSSSLEKISKDEFLDKLIEEKLILQEAEKIPIEVGDIEVDESLDKLMQEDGISEKEFESQLSKQGITEKDFRKYYKNSLVVTKFLNSHVLNNISAGEGEAKKYFEENPGEFTAKEGQIRARHILVETESEAGALLEKLKKGVDFAKLARENSTCPSSKSGGDLGFFSRGSMVEGFEDTAFGLNVNELSEPLRTQFGWHIIQRLPSSMKFSEAREMIIRKIGNEEKKEQLRSYVKSLRENADIGFEYADPGNKNPGNTDDSCIDQMGVGRGTVIFYHSDSCGYCNKMKPIIEELEEEGYDFHWAETSEEDASVVRGCYADVLGSGVPEFICAGSRDVKIGAMSKSALKSFSDNCRE